MAVIRGNNLNNTMRGTTANDVLWGLNGADTFYWRNGMGNDTIHGGDLADKYDANPYTPGNPGGDRLVLQGTLGAKITFSTTENGIVHLGNNTLSFTGIERFFGTMGNDVIRAGGATLNSAHGTTPQHGLTIFSRGGHDKIIASRFDDIIDGGAGNDTINAGAGNDFIHSSTGNDLIYGGVGDENIRWGTGNNTHNPGHDTIYGGAGNDLINIWIKDGDISRQNEAAGIRGVSVTIDRIGAANNFHGHAATNIGGKASLEFYGFELGWTHAGNDTVSAANAVVGANKAGFNFNTRWGHDVLVGSRGNDTLVADEGKDTVTGGAGNDQLWIGEGEQGDGDRDVLIFRKGDGHDTVFGFDTGLDVLNLGGRTYTARETADGTLLNFGGGDTVLLSDVFDFI